MLVIGGPAVFAGYLTDPGPGGPRVSRGGAVRDGWLDTGDLGHVDADGFVYLTGRAKDLIIRGGHNIDPRVIEEALLRHPAVAAAAAVGSPDPHSGEVPVAYVVPADPGQFDEAELLAWAGTAIGERAARPKRIYPIPAIPLTQVGKHYKPALAADAAARAVAEALATPACRPAVQVTADHENGQLVVTVTGADSGQSATPLCRVHPHRPHPASSEVSRRRRPARRSTASEGQYSPPRCPGRHPARHRGRRRPGRLRRRPLARRLGDPGHPAGTPRPAASAAARGASRRRGRPDPAPHRRQRRVPGPVPAVPRAAPARRPAPGDGRIPPGAGRRARLSPGQHVPPARPGRAPAGPGRAAPADQLPPRRGGVRAGRSRRAADRRPGPGGTPAWPGERCARSPACLVLGCDGAGSTIRDLAGITMEDLGFTERWLVIDIRVLAPAWTPGTA